MKEKLKNWLFRPFEYVSDFKALFIGLAAILLSGVLNSLSNTHFDGILDIHFGNHNASLILFICEGLIDWLALTLPLFVLGLIFSPSSVRLIDVLGTQALARWPFLIAALSACVIPHQSITRYLTSKFLEHGTETNIQVWQWVMFAVLMLIQMATIIWMIILMYRAYSISCNLKNTKGILTFISALIIGEVISKFVLSLL